MFIKVYLLNKIGIAHSYKLLITPKEDMPLQLYFSMSLQNVCEYIEHVFVFGVNTCNLLVINFSKIC